MFRHFFRNLLTFLIVGLSALWPVFTYAKVSNDPQGQQFGYAQTGVYKAWDYTTGSSDVIVAIIDNGFDTFHPDLFPNVWHNAKEIPDNRIDDDGNGYVDDVWGWNFANDNNDPRPDVKGLSSSLLQEGIFSHGTVVAGLIGAVGNNGRDGSGLNWHVKLMNLKVIDNSGSGSIAPLGRAIRYAVDNGAQVINISMVGDKDDDLDSSIQYAYDHGVAMIAAAGNYNGDLNKNPLFPVCDDAGSSKPLILGVSAIGHDRRLAYFSNTGSNCIDITAPGTDIFSTIRYAPADGLPNSFSQAGWQGTSFAAPYVTGAAALIKSVRPDWRAPQIYDALLKTTQHSPTPDEAAYANWYGKGLLQVHRAVAYALGLPVPPTMFDTSTPQIDNEVTIKKPLQAKALALIDGVSGDVNDFLVDQSRQASTYQRPELVGADSVTAFGLGNQIQFVVAKKASKTERKVTVYNSHWQTQDSWSVPATDAVGLSIGDRDEKPVIIVSPKGNDKVVYRLYSLTGELLETVQNSVPHLGVAATMVQNKVYSVFATKKESLNLHVYEAGKEVAKYPVTDMGSTASITNGDFGSKVGTTLIIGSGPGVTDNVAIYSLDGQENRSFSPLGDRVKTGVVVDIFDADHDGALDIVTYHPTNTVAVRAWSSHIKFETEWTVETPINRAFVIPR